MKKNTVFTALIAILMIVTFASCQMYTGNLYKKIDDGRAAKGKKALFGDDISKLLDKASASEVADALADASTQEEAKGALEALGKKSVEDIQNLETDQKNEVLEAQVLATLGGAETTSAIQELVTNGTSDLDETKLMDTLVNAVSGVDTKATVVILKTAVDTSGSVPVLAENLDKTAVASAAAAVAVSVISSAGVDNFAQTVTDLGSSDTAAKLSLEKYLNGCKKEDGSVDTPTKSVDDVAAALLPTTATTEQKQELAAALAAISAAGGMEALMGLAGSM